MDKNGGPRYSRFCKRSTRAAYLCPVSINHACMAARTVMTTYAITYICDDFSPIWITAGKYLICTHAVVSRPRAIYHRKDYTTFFRKPHAVILSTHQMWSKRFSEVSVSFFLFLTLNVLKQIWGTVYVRCLTPALIMLYIGTIMLPIQYAAFIHACDQWKKR
jgi:hypothetical protein